MNCALNMTICKKIYIGHHALLGTNIGVARQAALLVPCLPSLLALNSSRYGFNIETNAPYLQSTHLFNQVYWWFICPECSIEKQIINTIKLIFLCAHRPKIFSPASQPHRYPPLPHPLFGLLHGVFAIVKNAGGQHGICAAGLYAIGQVVEVAHAA